MSWGVSPLLNLISRSVSLFSIGSGFAECRDYNLTDPHFHRIRSALHLVSRMIPVPSFVTVDS